MTTQSILLLGGSNFILKDGFHRGLCEAVAGLNSTREPKLPPYEIHNLALGGCGSAQILLELYRPENLALLKSAKLIIVESTVNDVNNSQAYLTHEQIAQLLYAIGARLAGLGAPVLFLILPLPHHSFPHIPKLTQLTRAVASHFGFNLIDMQSAYERAGVLGFFATYDLLHGMSSLAREMARRVAAQLDDFAPPKPGPWQSGDFRVLRLDEFTGQTLAGQDLNNEMAVATMQNSFFSEQAFPLRGQLRFPPGCEGYALLGLLLWEPRCDWESYYSYVFESGGERVVKAYRGPNLIFQELNSFPVLAAEATLAENAAKLPVSEACKFVPKDYAKFAKLDYVNVICVLLARGLDTAYLAATGGGGGRAAGQGRSGRGLRKLFSKDRPRCRARKGRGSQTGFLPAHPGNEIFKGISRGIHHQIQARPAGQRSCDGGGCYPDHFPGLHLLATG